MCIKRKVFKSSDNFTIPCGVTKLTAYGRPGSGGGGGGGRGGEGFHESAIGSGGSGASGGGAGGSCKTTAAYLDVVPHETYTILIGAGGFGGIPEYSGCNGGTTWFSFDNPTIWSAFNLNGIPCGGAGGLNGLYGTKGNDSGIATQSGPGGLAGKGHIFCAHSKNGGTGGSSGSSDGTIQAQDGEINPLDSGDQSQWGGYVKNDQVSGLAGKGDLYRGAGGGGGFGGSSVTADDYDYFGINGSIPDEIPGSGGSGSNGTDGNNSGNTEPSLPGLAGNAGFFGRGGGGGGGSGGTGASSNISGNAGPGGSGGDGCDGYLVLEWEE